MLFGSEMRFSGNLFDTVSLKLTSQGYIFLQRPGFFFRWLVLQGSDTRWKLHWLPTEAAALLKKVVLFWCLMVP